MIAFYACLRKHMYIVETPPPHAFFSHFGSSKTIQGMKNRDLYCRIYTFFWQRLTRCTSFLGACSPCLILLADVFTGIDGPMYMVLHTLLPTVVLVLVPEQTCVHLRSRVPFACSARTFLFPRHGPQYKQGPEKKKTR